MAFFSLFHLVLHRHTAFSNYKFTESASYSKDFSIRFQGMNYILFGIIGILNVVLYTTGV